MTMVNERTIEPSLANEAFAQPASSASIDTAASSLRAAGFDVHVVDGPDDARDLALGMLTEGSEVGQGASVTLEQIGVTAEIEKSGRFVAIRPKIRAMDRATQAREIRRLSAAPDFFLASAHAVSEDGHVVIVSNGGSQLGPIASGAGRVILVVGAQKVVPDLTTAFRRIEEYALPTEDARMIAAYGRRSSIGKMLVLTREMVAGRISVILVRQAVGAS